MNNLTEINKINPLAKLIWLFMLIVLITSPLFPGKGTFGFHSVEWSFYIFVFFFMFIVLISLCLNKMTLAWDNIYKLFFIYWLWGFVTIFFAANKIRAILFWGQYFPLFFLIILCISLLKTEKMINEVVNKLSLINILYCIIIIIGFIIFKDRGYLNDFVLNNFQMDVTKILPYMELPLCVAVTRLVYGKKSLISYTIFILGLVAIVISGTRGSILVLAGILGLAFIKSGKYLRGLLFTFFAGLLFMLAIFLAPYTLERFIELKEQSGESFSRLYTGKVAFRTMMDRPLFGVGMGNLSQYSETAMKQIQVASEVEEFWKRRMLYETTCSPLKMGAEIGILGFMVFFLWYFTLWRRIKDAKTHQKGDALILLTGLEIYVIASFVHNFIDLGFYNYYSWLYYGIVLAAANVYRKYKTAYQGD